MVICDRKVVEQAIYFSNLIKANASAATTATDEEIDLTGRNIGGISGMKRVIDLHLNPERLLNFSHHHQNGGLVSSSRDRVPGDGGKMSRLRSESPPPSSRSSISPPHQRLSSHHHHHHHSHHHNHHNHRNSSSSSVTNNPSGAGMGIGTGSGGNNSSSSTSNHNSSSNAANALNAINSIPNSLIPLIPNPAMLLSRLVMPVAAGSPPRSESPRHNDSSDEDEGPKDFRGNLFLQNFTIHPRSIHM